MKIMKKLGFLTLAVVALFFTACDPDDQPTKDVKVTGLALNKTSVELEVDGTERLIVTKTPADATTAVVWKSSVDSVATVNSSGIVTALKPGSTVITASADGISATCTVTVLKEVDFSFTQGEIYGYQDFDNAQYIQAYLYDDGIIDVEKWVGDGFGMRVRFAVPTSTGVAIPAGSYTFADFAWANAVPNKVQAGYTEEQTNQEGSWLMIFVDSNQEMLDAGWEAGAYFYDPLIAGVAGGNPFDVSFDVSVENGVYTFLGEFALPAYDDEWNVIEGESDVYTFRFKGELPDNTPAEAPAAVRSLNTLNSKVRIPWLKK